MNQNVQCYSFTVNFKQKYLKCNPGLFAHFSINVVIMVLLVRTQNKHDTLKVSLVQIIANPRSIQCH